MKCYSRVLDCAAIFVLTAFPVMAQSVALYENADYDGTYVTVTGILQYTANNCSWCSSASHTYQQTATITSPTGRIGSCSFYYSAGAAQDQNMQCEAYLLDNGEDGDYQIDDHPTIACTVVGTFLNADVADIVELHNSGYGMDDISTCHWIPFGTNCPGPSSQAHNTVGCGTQGYKQCRDSYNRTTQQWKYRIVCVGQNMSIGLFCN